MACLFLENVPMVHWKPESIQKLLDKSRDILGDEIEIHKRSTVYTMLTRQGEVHGLPHGVHGFIHWHEGKTVEQMEALGNVIQEMLDDHGIGEGFDLTFVAGPANRSFYFNRQMVRKPMEGK